MRHPTRRDLIDGLNEDLARAYASVIQGCRFASTVHGTDRLVLRPLFAERIRHGTAQARVLADAVVALGGTPTTDTMPVLVSDEPAGMLRLVHEAERTSVDAFGARIRLAHAVGERSTELALGTLIADATHQRNELELWLARWVSQDCSMPAPLVRSGFAARRREDEVEPTTHSASVGITFLDDDRNAGSYS